MMTTGRSVGGCCDGFKKPSWLGLLSNTEHREAEPGQNYTERALAAQLGDAEGSRRITPDAIAAVETCLGLYESRYSLPPLSSRWIRGPQAITPAILGLVGRELGRVGNCHPPIRHSTGP